MPLPARKVGNKVMTPRPLLLCSRLWALYPGSCSRGLPLGVSGHLRAQRSTQEPGAGGEARVRLRLRRPELVPGCTRRRLGAGRVEEGRGSGGRASATPPPFCLPGRARRRRRNWAPGAGAAAAPGGCCGVEARAAPEGGGPGARRMCCLTLRRPLGSRSSGTQHFLSLCEPDTDSSLGAPRLRGSPRPRPTPSTPHALRPSRGRALRSPSVTALVRRGWRRPKGCGKQNTWGGQPVYLL